METLVEIKCVKNIDGQPPSGEWSNTYYIEMTPEMIAGDVGGVGMESDALKVAAQGFLQMETGLHIPNIRILRAVCTTPETRDDLTPQHLRVVPWGKLGARPGGPNDVAIPLEVVLKISFAGKTGRAGANSYRGALYSGDVVVGQGGYRIVAGIDQYLLDGVLGNLNQAALRPQMRVVSVHAGIVTSRFVASIKVAGVSTRQRTQKKKRRTDKQLLEPAARLTRGIDDVLQAQADLAKRRLATPNDPVVQQEITRYNNFIGILPTFGVLP